VKKTVKQMAWRVFLSVTLLAIVAGCAPTAAPGPAANAPAPEQAGVIELNTEGSPQGADWMMVASEENPKKGGTLTTAWGMAPTHFDMHQGGGCAGCAMMYNGLIMWNVADGYHTIVPALATEWTTSDDGLTYTFKLREGVKFQDGTDFDSKDVLATFNRILKPPSNVSISGI